MDLERLIAQATRGTSTIQGGCRAAVRPMDRLLLVKQAAPGAFETSLYEPVLCVILKGRKQVAIGDQNLSFGPGECLLVSHELPVRSQVTHAPYLALIFDVDIAAIRTISHEITASVLDDTAVRVAETHTADSGLLDALCRYLGLADSKADAQVLGPLICKEIHYRLLTAPFGGMLRHLLAPDSHASAVARAMGHIRGDLRTTIAVPELARRVGMSPSSFHKNFKAITSTTPLQYQKELRLLEARRLITTVGTSVTTVAYEVGYESPSQFSREYVRKFGVPPSQEPKPVPSNGQSSSALL